MCEFLTSDRCVMGLVSRQTGLLKLLRIVALESFVTQLNGKICHRHVLGKIESSEKADKHQSHLQPQDSQQL